MGGRKIAEINWTYPRSIDSAVACKICNESWGVYSITRRFAGNDTLLYIGMTFSQNFIHRINSHQFNWLDKYRGEMFVRFGEITKPRDITKDVVEDIESCLIYEMQPRHNRRKILSYGFLNEYIVLNTGYRGIVTKKIVMHDH